MHIKIQNKNEVGQLFMIGIASPKLQKDEIQFIRKTQPAGVIYFRRNVESPKQLRSLSKQIYSLYRDFAPLIAIDQEGGRVARLGEPFTAFPGNIFLGRIYNETGNLKLAVAQARAMAQELKAIGVNYNFTPVADIDTNPKNPIIGGLGRSFGTEPKMVGEMVAATVQAYRKEKVVSCAKHFPGHGDTFSDSHKVLPTVQVSKATLLKRELLPFKYAIAAGVPTMMTAHVVYKALDSKQPATLSHAILTELLRKKLQYKGVIVSDDLEMKAIANHGSIHEAGIESIWAGADLLLICKSLERSEEVNISLQKEIKSNIAFRQRIQVSLARIGNVKKGYLTWIKNPWPPLPARGWEKNRALSEEILKKGDLKLV